MGKEVYDPESYYRSFKYSINEPDLLLVGRELDTWRYSSESWDPWNGYYGLADVKNGVMIVPANYDTVGDCSDGLYQVKLCDAWGYFDPETYREVIPCRYDEISHFVDGVAVGRIDNVKFKLDKSGNILEKESCGE